jgi:hypothetical protein
MSRRLWQCRHPACRTVLGRVTEDGGLVLTAAVPRVCAYFDTGRADVVCPLCGVARSFQGRFVLVNA